MSKNRMKNRLKARNNSTISSGIDIVIPVFGRFDLLEKCLNSIPLSCTKPYRIILVDNSSPNKDEAKKFYASHKDKYNTLLQNHINYGYPFACNRGAKEGNSEFIFFLNSDVILEPGSLDKLITGMDDPKIAVCGMMLIFPEYAGEDLRPDIRPAGKVQHIGIEMNEKGEFIHMYVGWSVDNPKVLARHDSYAVTGAALLVRRNLFMKVGMYDVGYGAGCYEDVDLCLTLRDVGYNVIVVPEARAIHYTGATAEHYKIGFPMNENKMRFFQKWQKKLNVTAWRYF